MKNSTRPLYTLLQDPKPITTNGSTKKHAPSLRVWMLCLMTLLAAPYSYHQCQLIEAFAHKRDVQNGLETVILGESGSKRQKLKWILDIL